MREKTNAPDYSDLSDPCGASGLKGACVFGVAPHSRGLGLSYHASMQNITCHNKYDLNSRELKITFSKEIY